MTDLSNSWTFSFTRARDIVAGESTESLASIAFLDYKICQENSRKAMDSPASREQNV